MESKSHIFSSIVSYEARKESGRPTLVERLRYNQKNASSELHAKWQQHNEAMVGKGLKYLRSFLSNVVGLEGYAAAKPLLDAVNGSDPASSVKLAKAMLSQTYNNADEQFIASQIALSVAKYPFSGMPEVARANGLAVFFNGERRNRHFNALFRARRKAHGNAHDGFLSSMCMYVREVLGERPMFDKWVEGAGWGPGASVGVSGQFTNFARKLLSESWTVTQTALPYAITLAKRLPVFWEILDLVQMYYDANGDFSHSVTCVDPDEFIRRFLAKCVIVDHNNLATVPKDADKDRVIASEPLLNQLCQMAADWEMRQKLRRCGIDLRDQSLNQLWAREGSAGGYNPRCTVDIRNASGSIFIELVREVTSYCPEWFVALNAIRSPSYRDPKVPGCGSTRYHMFSSMGNGTTFPLETLIFASMCFAAHRYCGTAPDFRCYGDDVVIRQNEALVFLEKLRYFGLQANADKTFIIGPFRESCGSDWYNGEPVRPIVFDTTLDKLEERVRLHNALVRLPRTVDAIALSNCCRGWFPSFTKSFVRLFGDHTDEAIDGRYQHMHPLPENSHRCQTFDSHAWYGISFKSAKDLEICGHRRYPVALHYAAMLGASSANAFTARRETSMRVTRFSHSGNTSSWTPPVHNSGKYPVEWTRLATVIHGPSAYVAHHHRESLRAVLRV